MSKSRRVAPSQIQEKIMTRSKNDRPSKTKDTEAPRDDLELAGLEDSDSFALSDQAEDMEPVDPEMTQEMAAQPGDSDEEQNESERSLTPSWFGNTYSDRDSDALANSYRAARAHAPLFEQPSPEAYDAYRRRLEERFQSAKRMAAAPVLPYSTMPSEKAPPAFASRGHDDDGNLRFREWQKKMNARQSGAREDERRSHLTPARIAGLFVVACTIGGVAGLASGNMGMVRNAFHSMVGGASSSASALMAAMPNVTKPAPAQGQPQATQTAAAGGSTVLTKKPVRMARVDVSDASGALNNPIPLDLTAVPADPEMPLALKITGLPNDAYLTQGTEVADGEWLLKPTEIEGVKLVVPQAHSPQLDLAVAAVEEKTGVAATPPREMTVELDLGNVTVQPANAPPENQTIGSVPLPQAIPLPQEESQDASNDSASPEAKTLLGKGEALLKTGDLVSARQFFIKAHGLGLAAGAFGAGQTYDPAVYAAMNVHGLDPDPGKAREWYDKAAAQGHEGAIKALETLNAGTP